MESGGASVPMNGDEAEEFLKDGKKVYRDRLDEIERWGPIHIHEIHER